MADLDGLEVESLLAFAGDVDRLRAGRPLRHLGAADQARQFGSMDPAEFDGHVKRGHPVSVWMATCSLTTAARSQSPSLASWPRFCVRHSQASPSNSKTPPRYSNPLVIQESHRNEFPSPRGPRRPGP